MEENIIENKKQNRSMIIISILIALLIITGAYSIYNANRYKKVENSLKAEKEQIVQDLNKMEQKFNKAIGENTEISEKLKVEKNLIVSFRDSIKDLKHINYKLVRKYRSKLASLTLRNEQLLHIADSLKAENKDLTIKNTNINNTLANQIDYNNTLVSQNLDLASKVKIGGILNIDDSKVIAMKEKSNNTYKVTNKAAKTSLIKIILNIGKNELSASGDKQIYIVIHNTKGDIINSKGTFAAANGSKINYTEVTTINYQNEPLEAIVLIKLKSKQLKPDKYTVSIYEEGKKIGTTSLILKGSFLGL